ncbi:hypothetical protein QFW77_03400 [Luteimonas sp. RD2P54]|uniref:Uncharacterized protein n=1 Tax=Luteimonas endophytica TaxID=3042023 RepID=A0ABT6J5E7_9GAMM|nr:hypothetical protein [Luteimonas endophytica]MDH5822040.1 hypothetical protein [Luteimonas endophytica]
MSSIGSDPHLNVTGLGRLDGQVALDDLRQQGPQQAPEVAQEAPAAASPAVDAGERVLGASAWEGFGAGTRMLAGDLGFESALGGLDLAQAADRAADAILDALA